MSNSRGVLDPRDASAPAASALRDWLDLQQARVFEPQRAVEDLRRSGSPRAAREACGAPGLGQARLESLRRRLAELGVVAVPWGAAAYPECLAHRIDAPPLLLLRGDVEALAGPCVAIVGSRAATAYGRSVAGRFAAAFASAGYVVVSGLATGVDGVAHESALDVGGRTLAVMACGPEQVYPRRHRRLADRIVGAGAVVTEFPLGTPPRAPHFPLRNRIISGLSAAVLVVEARERSGSLVTANLAARQGVDVWAVPGPIDAATSAGTNRLLRDGAGVATAPEEVIEELVRGGAVAAPLGIASASALDASLGGGRVLAALGEGPLTRDALARRLDCAPGALALELLELELAGRVVEDRDGRLRRLSPPGR